MRRRIFSLFFLQWNISVQQDPLAVFIRVVDDLQIGLPWNLSRGYAQLMVLRYFLLFQHFQERKFQKDKSWHDLSLRSLFRIALNWRGDKASNLFR